MKSDRLKPGVKYFKPDWRMIFMPMPTHELDAL